MNLLVILGRPSPAGYHRVWARRSARPLVTRRERDPQAVARLSMEWNHPDIALTICAILSRATTMSSQGPWHSKVYLPA